MLVRESTAKDQSLIAQIHQDAFGESEGEVVSKLVMALLEDQTARPLLSLLAEENGEALGHILFTPVTITGNQDSNGYILSPLAVYASRQKNGVGTALIKEGLSILKQRGAQFVLVLGDPNYYSRTGFKAGHSIAPPYKLKYPEAWMAQELRDGVLSHISGKVQCAASLNSPELW